MSRRRAPSKEANYEVGYGRPPVEHRFKKGQSGNPTGRAKSKKPKKERESLVELLDRVSQQEITMAVDNRHKTVTMMEAMITKTFQQALAGKQDAVRTILSHFGQVDDWIQNRVVMPASEEMERLAKDPHEIARLYKLWINGGVPSEERRLDSSSSPKV
jgi:hypothetical protein